MIENANIVVYSDGVFIAGAVSNSAGVFAIAGLKQSEYDLEVSFVGYKRHLQKVIVEGSQSLVVVIEHSFYVRIYPHQIIDMDKQHKRPVHLKLQGPAHQVLILFGQQLHKNLVPAKKYRHGPKLRRKILFGS